MFIPPLKYNQQTLPISIWSFFCSLGYHGKVGEDHPPFKRAYTQIELKEYPCYPVEIHYYNFVDKLNEGLVYDKKGRKLNVKTIKKYLVLYSKGFQKGYSEYIDSLKGEELFTINDKQIAYKIFERVYQQSNPKDGNLSVMKMRFSSSDWDLLGSIETEEFDPKSKVDLSEYVTEDLFYNKGIEGGEYYKAWEIILSSPTEFEKLFNAVSSPNKSQNTAESQKPKCRLRKVALKYFYENNPITRENANKIATEYGHKSGEKLFHYYTEYSSYANRKGKPTPFTRTKLNNKIELFKSVVELLPESHKQGAIDDVSTLEKIFEDEFEKIL